MLLQTISRLTPLLNDPELEKKIDEAASKTEVKQSATMMNEDAAMIGGDEVEKPIKGSIKKVVIKTVLSICKLLQATMLCFPRL